MTFLVNQTKSYTLVVNSETGEIRLELADELRENLKELLAEAETSADAANAFFDVLGEDAFAFVEAMDALLGVGGELAAGFGSGGVEAMEALLADLAANSPGADLMDRVGEQGALDGFGFVEMPGDDVADMLGWAMPSGDNPFAYDPANRDQGLMQDSGGEVTADRAIDTLVGAVAKTVGGGIVGGLVGAAIGSVVPGAGTAAGAKVGAKVGATAGFAWGMSDVVDLAKDVKDDLESKFIPADPDEGYINPLDNPFGPEWTEDEALDPTYGQILTDPNAEGGPTGEETYDPEAELAKEILTNPEDEQRELTAGEVMDAATAPIVQTTLPVEPEPEFEFNFGEKPDIGNGEDFDGTEEGVETQAGATEYIILLATEEDGPDLHLQGDEMVFVENPQSGGVSSEGVSGAIVEGQLTENDMGLGQYDLMF